MNLIYQFQINRKYSRLDIFNFIGIPDPKGGNWYTGYTSFNEDNFIFCGVGTPGRTGHDYPNRFIENNALIWYGKTGSLLRHSSIKRMLSDAGNVYLFFREKDNDKFTFAGIAKALSHKDGPPVEIIWKFIDPVEMIDTFFSPDEIIENKKVPEGAKKTITVNVYERDSSARQQCINHWGNNCIVCDFSFSEKYGQIGDGYIHVHHLKPLYTIGKEYQLDPILDLRPVCPNCHAMLHKGKTVLSIEELASKIKR